MRSNYLKTLKTAVLAISVLLLGVSVTVAQQPINLTAGPSAITLSDGTSVPMWGYTCGAVVSGSTATCAKSNPAAIGWSPVVITVPTGQGLQINLTNNLSFSNGNSVPTSLTIVGQLGGGLGTPGGTTDAPDHSQAQTVTWPASDPSTLGAPPAQGKRVRSFGTEVAAGTTTSLSWTSLRPGTYLLESGSHPSIQGPMGLYGVVIVTAPGTAYPGITYNADIPMVLSEIDPEQNTAVDAAVNTANFDEAKVWSGQPGKCGNPTSPDYHTCYPPAVNYSPVYYLINGVAFNRASGSASLFATNPATGVAGNVLVRLVNAGLRMHVPSIVGAQTGAGAAGFALMAEDGNPLPGVPRIQNEVFLAAGKTYDVMINAPTSGSALPIFDRQLSLSGNATSRDAGMLAYISVNGSALPSAPVLGGAVANVDIYPSVINGQTLTVSDPSKGVIANDINISGVKVVTGSVTGGTLTLNTNGTFTFAATATSGSFQYCGNGATSGAACTTVTLGAATVEANTGITPNPDAYTSKVATALSITSPGVLANDTDAAGYPLKVNAASVSPQAGLTVTVDETGGFVASVAAAGTYTFTYKAQNSQGTVSAASATVTLTFPQPSNIAVTLVDGKTKAALSPQDYRWIIEEDRTFFIDPTRQTNSGTLPLMFGSNFHTSYMPVLAQGCTGTNSCESGQQVFNPATGAHDDAVCENGICRPGTTKTPVLPSQVALDPTKRYYISVLPGDAMDPGHAMGGSEIVYANGAWQPVKVIVEPMTLPPAQVSVFVFEDDHPLNGEHDAGGGVDTLSPNEPGLGQFNITMFDDVGGTGDAAGQMTYDMFNMPLSNSLSGTIDPVTGADACPVSANARQGIDTETGTPGAASDTGITGVVPVCPKYEADGTTLSPLAGQAVIGNLPPGRYGIVATPGADRIARGENWLQTNTLDGGPAHDSFVKVSEPSYFQEFGPAGYHVAIGFAEPTIINDRNSAVCTGAGGCNSTVHGRITGVHMSRTPDERLYSSGSRDTFSYTLCYVSIGSPDGAEFGFTQCDSDGNFSLKAPQGDWKITVFDQWNDQIVDGISTPVRVNSGDVDLGDLAVHAWKQNLYTRTFIDQNGDGLSQDNEPGLSLVPTNIRFRDGSFSNFNSTDLQGFAGFNEIFPLFNWYVLETDSTRYKNTGVHVVNDAGGPTDGSPACGQPGFPACGNSTIGNFMARTKEDFSLPVPLRFPGSVYCDNGDCTGFSIANGPGSSANTNLSTGRIDPPYVTSYGWQGFAGQNQFLEFGKKPFAEHENGGIRGHVIYASTRPFDDPALLLQLSWEPGVPNVTINLYKEGTAPDGSQSLTLVDTTKTTSWDDFAQGFRSDGNPNMSCPGQGTTDPFYFTLFNQPSYLDVYNNGGTPAHTIPNNSQYKCYDGMHNWTQLQPAPYDGMYSFPSVTGRDPVTGKPTGTNCTDCTTNPDAADAFNNGLPMLKPGKYVVEVVVPPGYELVKEEDKNILLGDTYTAPATMQFAGLGNIFIMPDQASLSAYNPNNSLNPTTDLGASPRHEGDTGSVETFWPCVGQARIVPDWNSLFPGAGQNAAFAGAKRNLCDRKEVTLDDQMSALAKFYVFTSTHVAGHYTGIISDDFTSEFDPFSPHFGEKFSPANLPVSVKDWAGNEISRTYSDQFGIYNGLNFSSFGVNPPDPSGYVPQMMVVCMNDRGTGVASDPLYQDSYSQFCYELPFMPGQTGYFDTPVIPTTAFAEGYNHPDCNYPDATPAISRVDGDGDGPYVSAAGHTLTITSLGDQQVNNYGYSGPNQTAAPYNQKTVTRHYGFGATQGTVKIAGVTATVQSWSDGQIKVAVPSLTTSQSTCTVAQRGVTGPAATNYRCGQLEITAANGKRSVDAITVTVAGKTPTYVNPGQSIQAAIDQATAGDLIIVRPGTYSELLIMWKPVRLQGVGAASVTINADPHPSGKLDPWRKQIVCLFGLGVDGIHSSWTPQCAGANWTGFTATSSDPQVDRLPLEATVGWDATLNGNLAEQLQEPTLLGAYEGAAITVLSKGVNFPNNNTEFAADTFPDGTTLLNPNGNGNQNCNTFTSNFNCNPSRIDGISITNSSQGGGGVYVHGWAHHLEISNTRIHNNQGTLTGGITLGQGEHPDAYLVGSDIPAPGSCQGQNGLPTNTQLPYCFNVGVNIHNNSITVNSSEGDELFSATPSGAGGVTVCTGADSYNFNNNWVCGNLSTGDGGGFAQLGYVWNAKIQHNAILFNESTNPTVPTNGGGLLLMGAPDTDPTCPGEADQDCPLAAGGVGDGTGPNTVIDANLILGNSADSGAGGGLRLQKINGSDVVNFRDGRATTGRNGHPSRWNTVTVTNNIIANNVAGWDGAGVSLLDALAVNFVNNTVVSNDSTASSGALFDSFFAPLSGTPKPGSATCLGSCDRSAPQPSGLSASPNSAELLAAIGGIPGGVICPDGHFAGSNQSGSNATCRRVSYPILSNDVFWQNRSYYIGVGPLGGGQQNQQSVVALFNQSGTPAPSQSSTDTTSANGSGIIITGGTGACDVTHSSYWDIGIRGDSDPATHPITLSPAYSVLTSTTGYAGTNTNQNPTVKSQYCNGSRVPPELGMAGYQVPPGTNESNVPVPVFNLTPGATVDEGNNWINVTWGPLALTHPLNNTTLGDYALATGSPAIDYIGSTATTYTSAPTTDFFGNPRKTGTNPCVDVGAVDISAGTTCGSSSPRASVSGDGNYGNWAVGTTSNTHNFTVTNTGGVALAGGTFTLGGGTPQPFSRVTTGTFPTGVPNCGATLAVGASCTIKVQFAPATAVAFSRTLTVAYTGVTVTGSPVTLAGTGVANRAAMLLSPNPLTITLPSGTATGTGVVTLKNNAAAGGAQVAVTNVNVSGGLFINYLFNADSDNCSGTALAPQASCTVTVRFTNVLSPRGTNRTGTISFTDNGASSPQSGSLIGFATP